MKTFIINSSHASKGNFFERKHTLAEFPDNTPFNYDYEHNIDGIYAKVTVEAEDEFEAGINFVKESFDFEAVRELIEVAHFYGSEYEDLHSLIKRLNFFLSQ